jgi:bifunctional N-acetylglucosamine-1-phosphate-uridyltransferase/glucosamine-1-phosphate-acetyltransferase GlmU-like protein
VSWIAVVSALDDAAAFRSRVSVYLHPLVGRPVLWHMLSALADAHPPPQRIIVLHRALHPPQLPEPLRVPVETRGVAEGGEAAAMRAAVAEAPTALLLTSAVPLVTPRSFERLLRGAEHDVALLEGCAPDRAPLALAGPGGALAAHEGWRAVSPRAVQVTSPAEGLHVRDRVSLSQAAVVLRDRLVRQHQENGVTFLLPESVWLDCEVAIGEDTVVYPGVVIEGRTDIGSECVVGPHCRIIEASIGRGAELKGWNFIARTSIRNHAVLEPYVRRGFD